MNSNEFLEYLKELNKKMGDNANRIALPRLADELKKITNWELLESKQEVYQQLMEICGKAQDIAYHAVMMLAHFGADYQVRVHQFGELPEED